MGADRGRWVSATARRGWQPLSGRSTTSCCKAVVDKGISPGLVIVAQLQGESDDDYSPTRPDHAMLRRPFPSASA